MEVTIECKDQSNEKFKPDDKSEFEVALQIISFLKTRRKCIWNSFNISKARRQTRDRTGRSCCALNKKLWKLHFSLTYF